MRSYIGVAYQFVHVDTAFALPRVLMGFISAGYSHGRGSLYEVSVRLLCYVVE
jgi:hypothetical protein